MQSPYDENEWDSAEYSLLHQLRRFWALLLFLGLAIAGMVAIYQIFSPVTSAAEAIAARTSLSSNSAPIIKSVPARPVSQRLAQSLAPMRVGIISGHKGNDSGAVCEDGLTEAEVNLNIAEQVVDQLNAQGIRTELLDEFDSRLYGYVATAVVSIHADSCDFFTDQTSGYKMSDSYFTNSAGLYYCVQESYAQATELPFDEYTITQHMTDYHAFRDIALGTPAIILETGFMNLDRELLTTNAHIPAKAITEGILCYIDQVQQ